MLYLVDYLTFTVKHFKKPEQALEFLKINVKLEEWQQIRGSYSYQDAYFYNGIRIYYNGQEGMGVCVSMSGEGCRTYETISEFGWYNLFGQLLYYDTINITRLDIACDEKEGILNIKKVMEYTKLGNWVKRMKTWQVVEGNNGITVNFGSGQSNIRVRIYDKAAERGVTGHWIRCELQLRDDLAKNAVREVLEREDVGIVYTGVLNWYLRFYEPKDEKATRCPTTKWWRKFVSTAEKIRLFQHVGVEYNLQHLKSYLGNQAGNSLYTYFACTSADGDLSEFFGLFKDKKNKLNRRQRELIEGFIRDGLIEGYPKI